MKNITLTCIVLFIFSQFTSGQTVKAVYRVERDISVGSDADPKKVTLPYEGLLLRKGNRYLYYQKPLYFEKYPDGDIVISKNGNNDSRTTLCMDTAQGIHYKDFDSLIVRHRMDISGKDVPHDNYLQPFEKGFQEWKIERDTKKINGLQCQKATLTRDGKLQWLAWFTMEVEMEGGVSGIMGLPGLVVEAENSPTATRYFLQNFETGVNIDDATFWPAVFNQPFKTWRPLKKKTDVPAKSSKADVLNDIINQ
jgi:GLPGLI family protein